MAIALTQMGTIVPDGDLNRHVGSSGDGYEDVHGGYGFGPRNVDEGS